MAARGDACVVGQRRQLPVADGVAFEKILLEFHVHSLWAVPLPIGVDVQLILWPQVFLRCRRQLQSQIVQAWGVVSRWDGAASLVVSGLRAIDPRVPMPAAHDWR